MAPLSLTELEAAFAQAGIPPHQLGRSTEEETRERLLANLISGKAARKSSEALLVEYWAMWRLGYAADPDRRPYGDRLYVLSFAGAHPYVKIGRTDNFARRLREHRTSAGRHGYALFDAWASEPVESAHDWETSVLRTLRRRHDPDETDGEYFYGLAYDQALTVVDEERLWARPRAAQPPSLTTT
ncbi:GIY-YIG nuclease family protein [Kitasatospora sp. NA04385]|uniref:GIY-YIG nuclease family protein n=1 Tax=Kitasatospora sp. NA04385 TaxID=2742135 RepID=UPI00158FA332|nr:GIY-YIG nuclease family protein [Kitasatospora sp. NA04385]QKW20942.1 GIY-YIG nuclease family protein [Kitasatospora sp. NA04385]